MINYFNNVTDDLLVNKEKQNACQNLQQYQALCFFYAYNSGILLEFMKYTCIENKIICDFNIYIVNK